MTILKTAGLILALALCLIFPFHLIRKRRRRKAWQERYDRVNIVRESADQEEEAEDAEQNHVFLKIQMYLISLWLLFVLIIPITIRIVPYKEILEAGGWEETAGLICRHNLLPLICAFMALFGFVLFRLLEHRWNGTRRLPVEVASAENENFEYLTFLTTYIIPLVCINLDEVRYVFVLFILLIIIGVIFVRSDFYLGNPTLALMNYKLYRIRYVMNGREQERMIITRDKIRAGDYVEAIPFDQHAWYVRRSK